MFTWSFNQLNFNTIIIRYPDDAKFVKSMIIEKSVEQAHLFTYLKFELKYFIY